MMKKDQGLGKTDWPMLDYVKHITVYKIFMYVLLTQVGAKITANKTNASVNNLFRQLTGQLLAYENDFLRRFSIFLYPLGSC